jgi:hypothetical protein
MNHERSDRELDARVARAVSSIEARLRDEPFEHATYEELAALADGTLDDVQEEIVRTHLEDCAMCAAEAADLQQLAAAPRRMTAVPPARASRRWSSRAITLLAASLLVAISLGLYFTRGTREPDTPHPGPAPPRTLIAVRDANGEIALDDRGAVHGVPQPLAGVAATLLRAPALTPPSVLATVQTAATQLRGSDSQQLACVEPVGRIVLSDRPRFSWRGATARARVSVYAEGSGERVAASGAVRGSEWTSETPLPRGVTLVWQVRSGDTIAPSASAPPARFRIVDAAAVEQIESARRSGSHLLLGAALAKAGLRDEAAAELQQLEELNPGSPVARKLLHSLDSWPR